MEPYKDQNTTPEEATPRQEEVVASAPSPEPVAMQETKEETVTVSETTSTEPRVENVSPAPEAGGHDEEKSAGPIVGSVIIIVILIVGGLYFWGKRLTEADPTLQGPTAEEIANQEDPLLDSLQTQSTSDALTDIEEDLLDTNLENLDAELDQIDLSL